MMALEHMSLWLAVPYIAGTVTGSVFGAAISIKIENLIGAKT